MIHKLWLISIITNYNNDYPRNIIAVCLSKPNSTTLKTINNIILTINYSLTTEFYSYIRY